MGGSAHSGRYTVSKAGLKPNDSLLYTIQPFQEVLDAHQNELSRLEAESAGWEYAKTASL